MVSSLFQIVIGFTGLVGFLLRFIGPLTIAPTITLVGVALFKVAAGNAGTVEPRFTDTSLLRTIFIVPGKSPYIFSKFYPLNTDTPLMRTTDTCFLPNQQIIIHDANANA